MFHKLKLQKFVTSKNFLFFYSKFFVAKSRLWVEMGKFLDSSQTALINLQGSVYWV